ncbi:MAG: fumarylacetoacetate hydrolase [Candidatus Marinimicrobia bacterium]|nr:fumarylacetoacetate hydrolase [Candidatus Neomarinimicrobiota bacterium]|tara:strand:- start:1120 stop:2052 length:933 start_codon:yes stop_codon:yes gene_type:complete
MKLVTFKYENKIAFGALKDEMVFNLKHLDSDIPNNTIEFITNMDSNLKKAEEAMKNNQGINKSQVEFLSPVLNPPSVKDGYAFRQHVATARRNRGLEMIPEFDEIPIFYFTNHHAIFGEGNFPVLKDHLDKLDFELECAAVIGKKGRNISASEADNYIAGFMIMNDLSARGLQMQEMKLNLGPAKGKDFGSTFGPYLVTKDELEDFKIPSKNGDRYNLKMKAFVNEIQVSEDNLSNMNWTFAQIIERISYGADIFPGDIIGSGTCGTGCFLELNGSKITDNQWLKIDDKVKLEIEGLGTLENRIILDNLS